MKQQGRASEFKKKRTDVDHGPFKGTQLEFIIEATAGTTSHQYMFILHDGQYA